MRHPLICQIDEYTQVANVIAGMLCLCKIVKLTDDSYSEGSVGILQVGNVAIWSSISVIKAKYPRWSTSVYCLYTNTHS